MTDPGRRDMPWDDTYDPDEETMKNDATITAAALRHATLSVPAPRPATVELQTPDGPREYPIAGVERVGSGPDCRLVIKIQEALQSS